MRLVYKKTCDINNLSITNLFFFSLKISWINIIICQWSFKNKTLIFLLFGWALINIHCFKTTMSVLRLSRGTYAQFLRIVFLMIFFHYVRMKRFRFWCLNCFHMCIVNNLLILKLLNTFNRNKTHFEFLEIELIISIKIITDHD